MVVDLSSVFKSYLKRYPKQDQLKIAAFIQHVQKYGLIELEGRNKSSYNVPKDDPAWLNKVNQAQKYNLWHYHIGIPYYVGVHGDKTSEYVLHYILDKVQDSVIIVHMTPNPPLHLSEEYYLKLH